MNINFFNKPKRQSKLKKVFKSGVAYAFVGGWIASSIVNKIGSLFKEDDKLVDDSIKTVNDKVSDNNDETSVVNQFWNVLDERDSKYSDLTPSGNSEYGKYQGVDISNLNGDVDIKALKDNGINFVMIREIEAIDMDYANDHLDNLDYSWLANVEKCVENDMPFGIFIYSRATTENMARQEAVKVIKFLSKYNVRPDFPIYWDIEAQETEPLKDEENNFVNSRDFIYNNPEQVVKNFKAFAEVLEKYGYYVGIYASDSVLNIIDPDGNKLKDYSVWAACYKYGEGGTQMDFYTNFDPITPDYPHVDMFQFSCTGLLSGNENHTIDCNLSLYNYAKIIHEKGLNMPLDYELYFGDNPTYQEIVDGDYPKTKKVR